MLQTTMRTPAGWSPAWLPPPSSSVSHRRTPIQSSLRSTRTNTGKTPPIRLCTPVHHSGIQFRTITSWSSRSLRSHLLSWMPAILRSILILVVFQNSPVLPLHRTRTASLLDTETESPQSLKNSWEPPPVEFEEVSKISVIL